MTARQRRTLTAAAILTGAHLASTSAYLPDATAVLRVLALAAWMVCAWDEAEAWWAARHRGDR